MNQSQYNTILTEYFSKYVASKTILGEKVKLTEFLFLNLSNAMLSGLTAVSEIQSMQQYVVHRQKVSKAGLVNQDSVAYSVTMGTDVGDFTFNAIALLTDEEQAAIFVKTASTDKIKNKDGVQGNSITRNILLEFVGAAEQTQINVSAETWQIDFTARLNGLDDDIRKTNLDIYGDVRFFDDGFLVIKKSQNIVNIKSGVGYIKGYRVEQKEDHILVISEPNSAIYMDIVREGSVTSKYNTSYQFTTVMTEDYVDIAGNQHYIIKLCDIDENWNVIDRRNVGSVITEYQLSAADGYKYIGRCKSIAELRTIKPTYHGQRILVDAYYEGGTTGGGEFVADLQDLDTPDDGGICIVGNEGIRWKRVIIDKLSVCDFGADLKTISNKAFIDMANAVGYINVPVGTYKLSTLTIPTPIYFDTGAAIIGDNEQIITFTDRIYAAPQYIFKGDASYNFRHTAQKGENSRQAHVAWFGAKVVASNDIDQSKYIQKALDAFGNAREGELIFDVGNYYVTGPMYVPRCVKIKGAGQRRTVFNIGMDGFDVFTTKEQGCRFEDIQFEIRGYKVRTSGYFIKILHEKCDVIDVSVGNAVNCIGVFGHNARINKIMATFGYYIPDGGSVIDVQASNCKIYDVQSLSSFSPETIINIGGITMQNISGTDISSIFSIGNGSLITFNASTSSITRASAYALKHNGFSEERPNFAVKLVANNYTIDATVIDNVIISSHALNGFLFEQIGSNGYIKNINLSNIIIQGKEGIGFKFNENNNMHISEVILSETVKMNERDIPLLINGKPKIRVSPLSDTNTNNCIAYDLQLDNNSARTIDFRKSIYTGMLWLSVGVTYYGLFVIRAAVSPHLKVINKSENIREVIGELTGVSGEIGNITLGIQDGKLSVENRTGVTQRITVGLITGVI